jgi:hypothetical protein
MQFLAGGAMLLILVVGLATHSLRHHSEDARYAIPAKSGKAIDLPPAQPPPDVTAPEIEAREAPAERTGVDAANLYKNAFVLFERLTDDEKELLFGRRVEASPEAQEELFHKIQPIMALLHQAAKADYCDWALGTLTSDAAPTHFGKAQQLDRMARWNAAHRIASDPDGAVQDLAAISRLGHHLADYMLGALVQTGMERASIEFLREHAAALTPSAARSAAQMLASSTVDEDIARAWKGEAAMVVEFLRSTSEGGPAKIRAAMAGPKDSAVPDERAQAYEVERLLHDPARVAGETTYIKELYRRAAEAMHVPRPEFDVWWKSLEAEVPAHPLIHSVLPLIADMRDRVDLGRVQRAMALAGLAILQHGPAQLQQHPDPATARAFTYVASDGGFTLSSSHLFRDKPVRMDFATPNR